MDSTNFQHRRYVATFQVNYRKEIKIRLVFIALPGQSQENGNVNRAIDEKKATSGKWLFHC